MIGRFTTALAMLLAASTASATPFKTKMVQSKNTKKSSFINKVVSNARPLRRLDEEEQEIDLTGYSIKYQKCQFVKSYDDELAEEEDLDTVLSTNRFIIFRLCPSSSCTYNYGEYLIDMETYLEAAVEYEADQQEQMCEYCEEVCAADDDAADRRLRRLDDNLKVSCDSCVDECEKIENMEDNGYVEASNYIECQQIGEADDDGNEEQYFAGAMCASNGEKIKIGVFLDEDCSQLDSSLSVEDYLEGVKLSHALLKNIYNTESSIPCVQPDWEVPEEEDEDEEQNDEEEEEEVEVNEMCQELYEGAAKCESIHGFAEAVADYEGYENQAAQEDLVCSFISTLSNGAYDQSGEIVLKSKNSSEDGETAATGGQKFALTVFILGTIGFAVYAAQLHAALTKGTTGEPAGGSLA